MTKAEQLIMANLTEACASAIAYFNMKAQQQSLGLNKRDDDIRQELCNAVSAAKMEVHCGNLQRTHEAQSAIDEVKRLMALDSIPSLVKGALTFGPGISGGIRDGKIHIAHSESVDLPKPHITSDDELLIDVYRIVLDMKDKKIISIPNSAELITKFLNQRYERVMRPLELALCNDLKLLCPAIFKAVEDAHPSDSPIIGNAL